MCNCNLGIDILGFNDIGMRNDPYAILSPMSETRNDKKPIVTVRVHEVSKTMLQSMWALCLHRWGTFRTLGAYLSGVPVRCSIILFVTTVTLGEISGFSARLKTQNLVGRGRRGQPPAGVRIVTIKEFSKESFITEKRKIDCDIPDGFCTLADHINNV